MGNLWKSMEIYGNLWCVDPMTKVIRCEIQPFFIQMHRNGALWKYHEDNQIITRIVAAVQSFWIPQPQP